MGDMADVFNDMRAASKEKRASNREQGPLRLKEAGIAFSVHNDGAHIVISRNRPFVDVDYWPGTGAWRARGWTYSKRGVANLIAFLRTPL